MKTKLAFIALISVTVFSCSTDDLQVENPTFTKNNLKINSISETENMSNTMREGDSVNKNQDTTFVIPDPIPVIGDPLKPKGKD